MAALFMQEEEIQFKIEPLDKLSRGGKEMVWFIFTEGDMFHRNSGALASNQNEGKEVAKRWIQMNLWL